MPLEDYQTGTSENRKGVQFLATNFRENSIYFQKTKIINLKEIACE